MCYRAEGSSKIQARIEQQSVRSNQPSSQFRAPTKPGAGVKTSPSPSKDNPSPEPQLDDIKRGEDLIAFGKNTTGKSLYMRCFNIIPFTAVRAASGGGCDRTDEQQWQQ